MHMLTLFPSLADKIALSLPEASHACGQSVRSFEHPSECNVHGSFPHISRTPLCQPTHRGAQAVRPGMLWVAGRN